MENNEKPWKNHEKSTWNHEKPWKTNLEPWKTMKNQPGTMEKHEKPWKTNLELYDSDKVSLDSSTNSGNAPEEINTFLFPDTYVVGVFEQGSGTPYNLSIL